jgi:hypothetical protein
VYGVGLMAVNVTTDLESDLIEGMLSCDMGQINAILNQYGKFSFFSHAIVDLAMWTCESPLQLDRHHRAYELGSIDWHDIFSRKSVDQCTDLFYDVIWSLPCRIVAKSFRGSRNS